MTDRYALAEHRRLFGHAGRRHHISKAGDSQSMFKALSRDTKKTGDGLNPSCAIIDEAAQIVGIGRLALGQHAPGKARRAL